MISYEDKREIEETFKIFLKKLNQMPVDKLDYIEMINTPPINETVW